MLKRINLAGAALVLVLSTSSSLPAPDNSSQLATKQKHERGYGCHGAAQCAALIDFIGTHCKDFRCNNDSSQPSCWCEL